MASHTSIESLTIEGISFVKKQVSVRNGLSYRVMHFVDGAIVSAADYEAKKDRLTGYEWVRETQLSRGL